MSNARNLADLLTSTGDVKSDALDNVDSLPTQTSNSGKVLMSDGTDASWVSAGRKNLIINGGFDVWQRGTSGDTTGNPDMPTADRWSTVNYTSGWANTTNTVGKTMTNDRNVYTYTGNSTDAGKSYILQTIENDLLLKGKTVTISFWAKVSSGTILAANRFQSTGGANVYFDGSTVDTTWKKHTVSFDCGTTGFSTSGGSDTYISMYILSAKDLTGRTFYLADVQLEVGSVATDFEHRSYGEELALCQRYYQIVESCFLLTTPNSTQYKYSYNFATTMRPTPTVTKLSGTMDSGGSTVISQVTTGGFNINNSVSGRYWSLVLKADAEL